MICGTYWKNKVNFKKELIYIILYTLSFSTLFVKVYFPFDVFLFNILFLQLPSVIITGTTLHDYLSGNKSTMIKIQK